MSVAAGALSRPRVVPAEAAEAIPGVYLPPQRDSSAVEPPRTGTPAFLGVRGIDRVICLDSWGAAVDKLETVTGKAPYAVRGFFANGGRRCYLVPAGGQLSSNPAELNLSELERVGDFDLVCAPDLATLPAEQLARAHARILAWCARDGWRFVILDAPQAASDLATYRRALDDALRGQSSEVPSFGAGYYPWLRVADARVSSGDTGSSSGRGGASLVSVPSSGHVAGIYSRTDRDKGVWSAPANEVVVGAMALDGDEPPAAASTAGFNAVRSFRKRGIRVWGARTLCDGSAFDYLTARRTLQAVARRLEQVLTPIVFEPNTPLLWMRINRIVSAQLDDLYRSGALAGNTPEEAYFVRCDADTNTSQARVQGQVVAEAGIAVVAPAEFITIDIRVGENDLAIFQHVGG
ncbi:phage tail sheath family protein [Luteimonas salinilitoris]|uniref:Phage tail sheath family protein n=1 Tax=Luteimonas salinilitoris TaxID=3237697 RepID=A0ABV4HT70_9GAMM